MNLPITQQELPMSLPFRYEALADRFAIIRPWAKQAVAQGVNRCTICMAYTMQIAPSQGDATITTLADPEFNNRLSKLGKVRFGPSPTNSALGGSASAPYSSYFFIRASELVPAVKRCFGQPDVQGRADEVWQQVVNRKGVIYLDNCYQTEGDKRLTIKWLYEPNSGCHWDMFDGVQMVAEEMPVAGNRHKGNMYFWAAR
jgi:hypothetical protein